LRLRAYRGEEVSQSDCSRSLANHRFLADLHRRANRVARAALSLVDIEKLISHHRST
jgi:hypothetical protein